MAPINARFRATRYHRQLANDVDEEHDADLVAVVPGFVLERVGEDQAATVTPSLAVAEADSGGLSVCVHRSVGGGVEVN
jgi:hypothetical protein